MKIKQLYESLVSMVQYNHVKINTSYVPIHAEAAQTYYKTLCQEQSLERRGKSGERKKSRRRHERTSRVREIHKISIIP